MPRKKSISSVSLLGGESCVDSSVNLDVLATSSASSLPPVTGNEIKPVGLVNLGNTCFFNSTLQALLATESFMSKLAIPSISDLCNASLSSFASTLAMPLENELNSIPPSFPANIPNAVCTTLNNKHGEEENASRQQHFPNSIESFIEKEGYFIPTPRSIQMLPLLSSFRLFVIEIRKCLFLLQNSQSSNSYSPKSLFNRSSSNTSVASPKSLFYEIATKWPVYRRLRQQDAHEFLRLFLGFLGDEEEKFFCNKKPENIPINISSPFVLIETPLSDEKKPIISPTITNRIFAGLAVSMIRCNYCNHISRVKEPFLDISLDLVPSSKKTPLFSGFSSGISLMSLLEKYFEIDYLSDGYLYDCENCSRDKSKLDKYSLAAKSPSFEQDEQNHSEYENENHSEHGEQCSSTQNDRPHSENEEDVISSLSDSLSSITMLSPTNSSSQLKTSISVDDHHQLLSQLDDVTKITAKDKLHLRKVGKWYRIELFPEVLVLHLKRFSAVSRGRFTKSTERVNISPVLDLGQFYQGHTERPCSVVYELYALVIHIGSSMESGHYVAHIRTDTNWGSASKQTWYYCSDTTVSKIDATKALSSEAYILFYKRIS